ncbi:MAG: ligand-binding sensor domain-containing protein [Chloroflexota bacterium]
MLFLLAAVVVSGGVVSVLLWPPSYTEQRWELTWDSVDGTFLYHSDLITSLAVAPNGDIWGGAECGMVHFDGQSWTYYSSEQINAIKSVVVASDGRVWAGSAEGLFRLDGDAWTTVRAFRYLQDFAVAANGDVWVATSSDGLYRFDGKTWTQAYVYSATGQDGCLSSVAVAPDGMIWAGSCYNDFRIDRFDGQETSHDFPAQGITGGFVNDVVITAQGDVWVGAVGNKGSGAGFSHFDGRRWKTYTKPLEMIDNDVASIAVERSGVAWLATEEGVCRFDGWHCSTYLPDEITYAVVLDANDDVWVGLNGAVARLRKK